MQLTLTSDPPLYMSFIEHWVLASGWTERDGPCYILFAREGLYYLLHQQ